MDPRGGGGLRPTKRLVAVSSLASGTVFNRTGCRMVPWATPEFEGKKERPTHVLLWGPTAAVHG